MLSWINFWKPNQDTNVISESISSEEAKDRLLNIINKIKYVKIKEREILKKYYDKYAKICGDNNKLSKPSGSLPGEICLEFDLIKNPSTQFGNAINNCFFIDNEKNGITLTSLNIYTVLYLSQNEPTWNDEYNDQLSKFLQNPDNILTYFNLFCWKLTEKNMVQLCISLS